MIRKLYRLWIIVILATKWYSSAVIHGVKHQVVDGAKHQWQRLADPCKEQPDILRAAPYEGLTYKTDAEVSAAVIELMGDATEPVLYAFTDKRFPN